MAYVHVQKDKCTGIGSDMEKCIFIGYLDGYKGWMFYNPTTKWTVISERAKFDERYFPGLKHNPLTPEPFEPPPSTPYTPVPDLGEDEDPDTNPAQENHAPLPQAQIAPLPLVPGAVITQLDSNGDGHPISFISKTLSPTERNYEVYDRELLVIIQALEEWWHYIQGSVHATTIISDHKTWHIIEKQKS